MKINKRFLIWLVPLFVLTLFFYAIFFSLRKEEIEFLEQITLALFTGFLITIVTSWVGYLHAKEEFFTDLFFKSISAYILLLQSRALLSKVEADTDINSLVVTLKSFIDRFEKFKEQINFMLYNPINKKSKEFLLVEQLQSLFFQLSIIKNLSIDLQITQNERKILDIEASKIPNPCNVCEIPKEERPRQAECSEYQSYSRKLQPLNQKSSFHLIILNKQISSMLAVLTSLMPTFNHYMSELNTLVRINFSWARVTEEREKHINSTIGELIKTNTQNNVSQIS